MVIHVVCCRCSTAVINDDYHPIGNLYYQRCQTGSFTRASSSNPGVIRADVCGSCPTITALRITDETKVIKMHSSFWMVDRSREIR
jgi:hypothetical protein